LIEGAGDPRVRAGMMKLMATMAELKRVTARDVLG
jgi:hypothetical protein